MKNKYFLVWIFFLTRYGCVDSISGLYTNNRFIFWERPRHLPSFGKFCDFSWKTPKNHKISQNLEDGGAVLRIWMDCSCRGQKSNLHSHTLSGKKSRTKNIICSWRNLIFKIWNLSKISWNLAVSTTYAARYSYQLHTLGPLFWVVIISFLPIWNTKY